MGGREGGRQRIGKQIERIRYPTSGARKEGTHVKVQAKRMCVPVTDSVRLWTKQVPGLSMCLTNMCAVVTLDW